MFAWPTPVGIDYAIALVGICVGGGWGGLGGEYVRGREQRRGSRNDGEHRLHTIYHDDL